MAGIVAYGTYVPYWRLDRNAIGAALGTASGKGTRAVASYDEDSTSMAVEAARMAMAAAPGGAAPTALAFATANPPYLDKTNAAAIHAALALDAACGAYDVGGAVRSGMAAIMLADFAPVPTLAVLSDVRVGLPGGADERDGGDGAAAFLYGSDGVIAERVGAGTATAEFLDRWRLPGDDSSHLWEERFGETAYVPLAEAALTDALKKAGITPDMVDHLIVTGLHGRAVRRVLTSSGVPAPAVVPDLTDAIGNTGTSHLGLLLADVLDRAEPNQLVVAVLLADGADAIVLRTTPALAAYRDRRATTVAGQVAAGRADLAYNTFLTWRGMLHREPPRRPDPERPSAPVTYRREEWKFSFTGSRCEVCGTLHLPPDRVCLHCHAVDQMVRQRMADVPGTIATYTIDRLAYSLSPPVVAAVVDFDGGGRYTCELTDVDPAKVKIGDRVRMTFRRAYTAGGVHNYVWKARPVAGGE
jgi:hydroxymethylglutaryl-CoA synthase